MSVSALNVKFHQPSTQSPTGMEEFNPTSDPSATISESSRSSSPLSPSKASSVASTSSDSTMDTLSSPEDSVSSELSDSSSSRSESLEERLREFYKDGDILSSPGKPAFQEGMKKSNIRREVTRLVDPCGNPFRKSKAQLPWIVEKDGQMKIYFHKKQKGYARELFSKLSDTLGASVTMDLDDKMTRKSDRSYHLSISIPSKYQRAFKRMISVNGCLPVFCMG
jgi:hypothetical protein